MDNEIFGMADKAEDWKKLKEEYETSFAIETLDKMLDIFWEPRKSLYLEQIQKNTRLLAESKKLWGGGKKLLSDIARKTSDEVRIVWIDGKECFYVEEGELKRLCICLSAKSNDKLWKGVPLAWNVMPDALNSWVEKNCFLYYDVDVLKCFLQMALFERILPYATWIFLNSELENYMLSFKISWFDYVINCGDIESVRKRLNNDRIKVGYDPQRIYTEGGLYPDKVFYVVRMRSIPSSIASILPNTVIRIQEAVNAGYIPVIDWSFFYTVFLEKNELYKFNPWEYFFSQPTRYSLEAAYKAQNIILGSAEMYNAVDELEKMISDNGHLSDLIEIYKKYIHVDGRIKKEMKKAYHAVIGDKQRVLGVSYRGTDYKNNQTNKGEYRQPSLRETMDKAKELMRQWKCDFVFFTTEDAEASKEFQKEFGDQAVVTERMRYPADGPDPTVDYFFQRDSDRYYRQIEYIIDIYILARCTCLLSNRAGMLQMTLLMNENRYENRYIYDLGIY